jgi:serine/threonine protein kinase
MHAGKIARLTFSLAYSSPETLQLVDSKKCTAISCEAADMWAVGVISYELLTKGKAFPESEWSRDDIRSAALGMRAYPWESEVGTFRDIPQLRVLTESVCACLARNPENRPSASQLVKDLNGLFDGEF